MGANPNYLTGIAPPNAAPGAGGPPGGAARSPNFKGRNLVNAPRTGKSKVSAGTTRSKGKSPGPPGCAQPRAPRVVSQTQAAASKLLLDELFRKTDVKKQGYLTAVEVGEAMRLVLAG